MIQSFQAKIQVTAGMIGPGKRWEHFEVNRNGKPIRHKMHVKKGDTVVVIAGDDKGTVENVTAVYPKSGRIRVQRVKPMSEGETGKIKKVNGVIDQSNVMHWSREKQVRSRVGNKITADGNKKKVKFLIKSGEILK